MSNDIKENTVEYSELNDNFFEKLYAIAFNYYQLSQYEQAADFFQYLIDVNPSEGKYYFSLAACYQCLENYDSAIDMYTIAASIIPGDARIYFHIGECCLHSNEKEMAKKSFEAVVKFEEFETKERFKELILRSKSILNQLTVD